MITLLVELKSEQNMDMLPRHTRRAPVLITALSLAMATALAGCASKNPLIDSPAPASVTASAPASATASATPEATAPVASADSTAANTKGAQTTGPSGFRRFMGIFSPHRVDIPQGNFVSEEMVAQLKEGQTEDQVRFILGTPLLTDVFHADRWDYPFRILKSNGEVTTSRISVVFKDHRVVKIEGGDLPTESEYLARISGNKPPAPAQQPSAQPTQQPPAQPSN